jgi:hypothetical protein
MVLQVRSFRCCFRRFAAANCQYFCGFQIKAEELEEIARVHYRKTFVLVGFSSGYANWPEVEGWIDETAQRFNKLLGPGDWIIIYEWVWFGVVSMNAQVIRRCLCCKLAVVPSVVVGLRPKRPHLETLPNDLQKSIIRQCLRLHLNKCCGQVVWTRLCHRSSTSRVCSLRRCLFLPDCDCNCTENNQVLTGRSYRCRREQANRLPSCDVNDVAGPCTDGVWFQMAVSSDSAPQPCISVMQCWTCWAVYWRLVVEKPPNPNPGAVDLIFAKMSSECFSVSRPWWLPCRTCRFAVEAGIRFKYFPCMDGKGRGFGPHHDWAIHLRTHTAAAATTAEPDADDGLDDGVCLSMHQPWASFVVAGIKRAEGRGWTSPYRGGSRHSCHHSDSILLVHCAFTSCRCRSIVDPRCSQSARP